MCSQLELVHELIPVAQCNVLVDFKSPGLVLVQHSLDSNVNVHVFADQVCLLVTGVS